MTTLCRTLLRDSDWRETPRAERSITAEIQFLLNHDDDDTASGKRLYSISYAWGGSRQSLSLRSVLHRVVMLLFSHEVNTFLEMR